MFDSLLCHFRWDNLAFSKTKKTLLNSYCRFNIVKEAMNVFVMITSNELHGDERAFLRWNFKGDAYGMIAFMLTLFIKFVLRFIHEIKKIKIMLDLFSF
jgi:hypothetical protein